MLKWLMRRRIAGFERAYGYDMAYAREILEVSPRALLAFARIERIAQYRRDVPTDVWYVAKLVAALAEDCGPCTQLVVTMAERAGVAPAVLRAVLARDENAMTADAALVYRFAEAVLTHDGRTDEWRDAVLKRWGRHGLISLSFAIVTSRFVPALKYALGHGQACTRVTVGGTATAVLRQASPSLT